MKINFFFVIVAIEDIIRTVSNQKWKTFLMETGKLPLSLVIFFKFNTCIIFVYIYIIEKLLIFRYCHECMNKATGDRNCIVCGKKVSQSGTKLILCELCPRAYHTDCIQPTLNKVPRGKWYCNNCISKKPQKKTVKKNHKISRESESSEHPPSR